MVAIYHLPSDTGISEAMVKAALDGLLFGTRTGLGSPLEYLTVVEEALLDTDLPPSPHQRTYLLAELLTAMIADTLARHRAAHGLPEPDAQTTRVGAQQAIALDAQAGHPELLGWSWLYYHYVRVDLAMMPSLFCMTAGITQRTLLRYQERSLRRLTFQLMGQEGIARQVRRRFRLRAQLPAPTYWCLYGRDDTLQDVQMQFWSAGVHHIQVFGESGVGKTALVQKLVRMLIDGDRVDHVIWVDTPTSTQQVCQRLQGWYHEQGAACSLREMLLRQSLALIVDGADLLHREGDALKCLHNELSGAFVFLTSDQPLRLKTRVGSLGLARLSPYESEQLIRALVSQWYVPWQQPITREEIRAIGNCTKGNPGAIVRAVYDWQTQYAGNPTSEVQ